MEQSEPVELNEEQKKMLAWIERAGAISPSKLAAETKTLPQDMWAMLEQFATWNLVVMREDPDSPDGVLVFIAMANVQQQQAQQSKINKE